MKNAYHNFPGHKVTTFVQVTVQNPRLNSNYYDIKQRATTVSLFHKKLTLFFQNFDVGTEKLPKELLDHFFYLIFSLRTAVSSSRYSYCTHYSLMPDCEELISRKVNKHPLEATFLMECSFQWT